MDKLNKIGTSAVEKLVDVKKDQDRLDEYRSKAESMKAKTSDSVYRRVLADYERRGIGLEEQAAPLQAEAQQEYQKLRAVYDQLKAAHEDARLNKEEIEFRLAVGELQEEQATQQLPDAESALETCRTELAEGDALKARFLEVLTVEEKETAPKPKKEAAPKPKKEAASKSKREAASKSRGRPEPEGSRGTAPAEADASDATIMMPLGGLPTVLAAMDAGPDSASSPDEDATVMVPRGILMTDVEGAEPTKHVLGAVSSIGRGPDNQIVVAESGVSTKHAMLTAGLSGFTLKDLKSRNGTFVNDKRITECAMNDGDRIRLGDVELVFRSA